MKWFVRIVAGLFTLLVLLIAGLLVAYWEPDRPVAELQSRWAPPPSNFAEIGGLNVHLRDEGPSSDPAPIVLIHGTSASLHTWDGWAAVLKDKRRVIRFDLPAHGLTGPSPEGDYSIDGYVNFVRKTLDRLGVHRCVLGGNSLGGEIAWSTALALPERVERLILVDAAGYPPESTSVPIAFRIAGIPGVNRLTRYTLSRRVVESSVRNVYGDPSKVTPELVERYFELTLREGNRSALRARFKQSRFGAMAHRIKEVSVPTLILWGERDRLIPPSAAERFRRDIAGSQLVTFPELGHVPQEEDPAGTVAAVAKFLGLN